MKKFKLIVNTNAEKYPILIGTNLISNLSKILKNNSIRFKQCLLVVDKNYKELNAGIESIDFLKFKDQKKILSD